MRWRKLFAIIAMIWQLSHNCLCCCCCCHRRRHRHDFCRHYHSTLHASLKSIVIDSDHVEGKIAEALCNVFDVFFLIRQKRPRVNISRYSPHWFHSWDDKLSWISVWMLATSLSRSRHTLSTVKLQSPCTLSKNIRRISLYCNVPVVNRDKMFAQTMQSVSIVMWKVSLLRRQTSCVITLLM